jgi:hypothetical protein
MTIPFAKKDGQTQSRVQRLSLSFHISFTTVNQSITKRDLDRRLKHAYPGEAVHAGGLPLAVISAAYAQSVKITSFDVPGAQATYALTINSEGEIAGYYVAVVGTYQIHGFLRDKYGAFATVDPPGSISAVALGINSEGQIVGLYSDYLRGHAFIWERNGAYTSFDAPGSLVTQPQAINSEGEVTGYYIDAAQVAHGFSAEERQHHRLV